jgi:hypothetical protein
VHPAVAPSPASPAAARPASSVPQEMLNNPYR